MTRPRAAGVAVVLGLAAVLAAGSRPASAGPSAGGAQLSVAVTAIDPVALAPGGNLSVSGTVTNRGSVTAQAVGVQLRVGTQPITTRGQLAALAGGNARPPGQVPVSLPEQQDLGPGVSLPFTLTVPVDDLGLPTEGIYALAVEVLTGPGQNRNRVATVRTFVPFDMAGVQPTRLAVLWPVLSTPARDGTGAVVGTGLHDDVAGRLTHIVDAAAGAPVTWVVDGDLLSGVAALAAGRPAGSVQQATPGTPDAVAAGWLNRLVRETGGAQVLAVPYADPDLVGAVRAGLVTDLTRSATVGPGAAAQVLAGAAAAPLPLLDWPADGTADRTTLRALPGTGASTVLLSDVSTATAQTFPYTPSGVGPLTGSPMTAVVADSVLSNLLATPASRLGGPVLARQRMLAELAMVGAERPNDPRSLVIVPPRRWNPDPDYVQSVLRALGAVSWVRLASLSDLTAAATTGPVREQPSYPGTARVREVDTAQYQGVQAARSRLDALGSVLDTPGETSAATDQLAGYADAVLRAESTAWRTAREAGHTYVNALVSAVTQQQGLVHLVSPGAVTLAARSGLIPITVVNDMNQPVQVRVGMTAVPAVRLTLVQPAARILEAHTSTTLDVAAQAATNGNVQVVAQLLTVDGHPYGDPHTFPVQITGLGAVAELIVAGALVLLTGALAVRVVRAVRSGRRRPGSPASVRERAR